MKFIVIFIGLMLVRGVQLHMHRHMNRHGRKGQMTDPQREINQSGEIDKAVDKQKSIDAKLVQKDVNENRLRSNPGNTNENTVY